MTVHTNQLHTVRPPARPPLVPRTVPDERPARRTLLEQIARLEEELAQLFCSTWPRKNVLPAIGRDGRGGPRVLSLSELEQLRDDLAERVSSSRRALSDRTYLEEQSRRLIEEMLLEPERHKWVRVGHEDIGEPGCKHWHVRPRWGPLGMLMNWWRVVVSSGCPLASAPREQALERYLERLPASFAGEIEALVECELRDDDGRPLRFQLDLEPGGCTVRRGRARAPAVTLSLPVEDFLRLIEGDVSPGELFLRQRLSVSGDVLLAVRLPQLFGLSGAAATGS